MTDTIYENDVTFFCAVPIGDRDAFIKSVTELTNGRAATDVVAQKYIDSGE